MNRSKLFLFYDGGCNLCRSFVKTIAKRDSRRRFQFITLQDSSVKDILGASFENIASFDSIIVFEEGKTWLRSEALVKIYSELPYPFLLFSFFIRYCPFFIREKLYKVIAKKRYQWFGRYDEQCETKT